MSKYESLKSMDVTHSSAYRKVPFVPGVSILNDSFFKNLFKLWRSSIGCLRLLGFGTKNSWL